MYILAPQNIKITLNFREENTVYSSDKLPGADNSMWYQMELSLPDAAVDV